MHLMMFEDDYFSNFKPLTYTRPVFELRCGVFSFLERAVKKISHERVFLHVREYLRGIEEYKYVDVAVNSVDDLDDDLILISGRLILNDKFDLFFEKLLKNKNVIFIQDDSVVAGLLSPATAKNVFYSKSECLVDVQDFLEFKDDLCIIKVDGVSLIRNIWDLIDLNHELLCYDFYLKVKEPKLLGQIDDRAVIYGDVKNIHVEGSVVVEGNVNVDARGGPVYIDENVKIQGPSSIHGPCYIGRNTRIVSGARIRSDCSIGETCRIGSEVESSIFHGYSNMYHTGFMGHSYVGEWVNIGALTANSDLKNTYGQIKMRFQGREVNTGKIKIGCFIGDHVKTSIGCQIYTGRLIGVSSHLHGTVFEDVPSFTIYAKSLGLEPVELNLKSAVKTMTRMYERRGKKPSDVEVKLMEKVFELTSEERSRLGVKRGIFGFRKI